MVGSTIASQRGSGALSNFAAAGQMTLTPSRASSRTSSRPGSTTASKSPPLAAALPSTDKMSEFWQSYGAEVVPPAHKLRPASPDPFSVQKVVTWKRMAKDQRASVALQAQERYAAFHRQSTDLAQKLSPAEDEFSRRVMINPVTMEEMLILPRPVSRERLEELSTTEEEDEKEECSPNKAYMIRNGGFPGSSHIAGENALLLMSSIY